MPPPTRSRLTPRKKPRQERSQHTMAALLDATARVLMARGWAKTTTNHVAMRAGVSIGTLYEYFPNKEAMATALLERHLEEAESKLAALAASLTLEARSLEGVVRAIVAAMIELHAASPRLHRLLFEEVPRSAAVSRRVLAMEEAYTQTLATLLPKLTPLANPEISARVVVELLEALTHRWIATANGGPLPRSQMQHELERLVLAYLRAA